MVPLTNHQSNFRHCKVPIYPNGCTTASSREESSLNESFRNLGNPPNPSKFLNPMCFPLKKHPSWVWGIQSWKVLYFMRPHRDTNILTIILTYTYPDVHFYIISGEWNQSKYANAFWPRNWNMSWHWLRHPDIYCPDIFLDRYFDM